MNRADLTADRPGPQQGNTRRERESGDAMGLIAPRKRQPDA
jgi:hypothetical protein